MIQLKTIATDSFMTANMSDLSTSKFHVTKWFSVTVKIKYGIQEMEISPAILHHRRSHNN